MDWFVVIAVSSSHTKGASRAFQYVATATTARRMTTSRRDILHYYLTHAASAGARDVPRALAAVCQPVLFARASHQLRDHRGRSDADELDAAVGVACAGAQP